MFNLGLDIKNGVVLNVFFCVKLYSFLEVKVEFVIFCLIFVGLYFLMLIFFNVISLNNDSKVFIFLFFIVV